MARVTTLCVLLVVSVLGRPSPATAADISPVEGTWNLENGQVLVSRDSAGDLVGTVTEALSFSQCTHPRGEQIWKMTGGSGGSYSGSHVWFGARGSTCMTTGPGPATFSLSDQGDRLLLRFCTNPPGAPAPSEGSTAYCADLTRAKPAPATPTAAASSQAPSSGQLLLAATEATDKRVVEAGGCYPRSLPASVFRVRLASLLRRRDNVATKVYQPRIVRVRKTLDGRPLGRVQTAKSYSISVDMRQLTPGRHTLAVYARVKLHAGGRQTLRRLGLAFRVCS